MAQPKFTFRLEALLDHRKLVEKEHQRKVAAIQQQCQALMRQITDAQNQIADQNRVLTERQLVGTLDMQYISHEKRFVGNLHMRIVLTMQKLAAMERTLADARALLLEAARSRKVIEKLREKQHRRWLEDLERKDAAAMDEIGTQLALRQAAAQKATAAIY